MVECPLCDGKGIKTVTAIQNDAPQTPVEIKCTLCDGTGHITYHMFQAYNKVWGTEAWCKCEKDYGATYFADGQHEDLHKHHWRCKNCDKILQIG